MKTVLKNAKDMAAKSANLKGLAENVKLGEEKMIEYEQMLNETVKVTNEMATQRMALDEAGKTFVDSCNTILALNEESMIQDLAAATVDAAKIKERFAKTLLIKQMVDEGNAVMTETWKSQAVRDPSSVKSR